MHVIDNPYFWEPRDCFMPPIPEIHMASELLSSAVDEVLALNLPLADELIRKADMPVLEEYATLIESGSSNEIRRFRVVASSPSTTKERTRRMPSYKVELSIYERDGWHCRFCQSRVISKKSRKKLNALLPEAARWGRVNSAKHRGLSILESTLDHLLPHSRGGDNSLENLVTACGPCQFGRGNLTLEEVGIKNPLYRPPILDEWDGLTRLLDGR